MRAYVLMGILVAGCHHHASDHVEGGVLGRVVIYRNGVAFYERTATIDDGKLLVNVPRDRVDDFLKSLTVVDRATKHPLAVAIPRQSSDDGNFLTMTIETPDTQHADVLLTYVTAAPAWKPSYRVVVGDAGKVMLESWAVVDNTSSEDWRGVLIGVGASSALAFRYDLWSVRQIDRDLLQGEQRFAIAPPTGVSPYAEGTSAEELAQLDSSEVPNVAKGRTFENVLGSAAGSTQDAYGTSIAGSTSLENTYVVEGVNTTDTSYGNVKDSGVGSEPARPSQPAQPAPPKAAPSKGNGTLRGTLTDRQTGQKAIGATVVATGPKLVGEQAVITDENGNYFIESLPPGIYTLTMYYENKMFSRANVLVQLGKEAVVNVTVDPAQGGAAGKGGEVISITGSAPIVDQGSTKTGVTITSDYTRSIPVPGRTFGRALGSAPGSTSEGFGGFSHATSGNQTWHEDEPKREEPVSAVKQGDAKLRAIVTTVNKDKRDVVVEVHGVPGTERDAIARGTIVKNKLVDSGVPAARIHVVPKLAPNESPNVRLLAIAPQKPREASAPPSASVHGGATDSPVGESHFMAEHPMTVRAGTSAMVAMVHGETTGGVVYLYDPISDRGDQRYAFKAVRLDNPTTDTLEAGPVTVYGSGRFIGEGITEPVPPKASVVVPFALDKQIVVARDGAEEDRIARLITVQRGVVTAELQHRRTTKFAITSRLPTPAIIYVRHRLESGWTLVDAPSLYTRVGDSHLFEVRLEPNETRTVTIAEATPIQKTFDLQGDAGRGMMKLYVEEPEASPELRQQIRALLATHHDAADLDDKIQTLRSQLAELHSRAGELNAQIVTLKAVRTSGDLMATLRARLGEISDREQKTTLAIVDAQEKLMLARVKFQNQLAELRLADAKPTRSIGAR